MPFRLLKSVLQILLAMAIFSILTVITQVGGVIYLCYWPIGLWIKRRVSPLRWRIPFQLVAFVGLYLLVSAAIVPPLARSAGRVPLPSHEKLYPLSSWTRLLNRHYVKPELKTTAEGVAVAFERQFSGVGIRYLDAGFPFFDRFPLLPHISHGDGKKLDIALFYRDASTGTPTDAVPSPIGYGGCIEPLPSETNQPELCAQKGYWQYSLMKKIVSRKRASRFELDEEKMAAMTNMWARQRSIGKIFLEPHLRERLRLTDKKIVFHGCKAVRHDDHLHVQLK